MSDKAQLRSVEALDVFRNQLVQYVERAIAVIDEVGGEVRGTRAWLEDRQRPYWEQQLKLRARALEEAQHEMFGARLSQFRETNDAQQMAVHRAKRALREAEDKVRTVKLWARRYESDIEPLGREVEKLRSVLMQDLKKGVYHLERILRTLDGYSLLAKTTRQGEAQDGKANEEADGDANEKANEEGRE